MFNPIGEAVKLLKKGCKETRKRGREASDSDDETAADHDHRDRRATTAGRRDIGVGAEAWHASAGRRADGSDDVAGSAGWPSQKRSRYAVRVRARHHRCPCRSRAVQSLEV